MATADRPRAMDEFVGARLVGTKPLDARAGG